MSSTFELGFSLYLIRSTATPKVYVGQTRQALERRWVHHKHMARTGKGNSCSALHAAMRKHGIDTFSIELLGRFATQEEINAAEEAMIYVLCSQAPHGYNLKEGGKASGHSPETRAKMSLSARKRGYNRPGYKHSEETKARMRAANAGRACRGVGWSHSEETKAKLSLATRGRWD